MKVRTRGSWRARMTRAATLLVITALIPLPAAAAGREANSPSAPTMKVAMEKIIARDVTATPMRKGGARESRQGSSAGSSPGFFKTKPGIIALVVMGAGVGYALYSAQNDRIHSPGKE